MSEMLSLQYARTSLASFSDEVMQKHYEAMECFDCETFLQEGIHAFGLLVRSDEQNRSGEFHAAVDDNLRAMFRQWLGTSAAADKWIAMQEKRGFALSNLAQFRRCQEEVRAIVQSFGGTDTLSPEMATLCDEALTDHRNGNTTEFTEEHQP